MDEAITNAGPNLADFVREKLNSLITVGEIDFFESGILFTVNPSSTLDLFTLFPFSSQVPLPTISLDQVEYNFDTKELTVTTRRFGSQTVIPDVLELQNVAFSYVVVLDDLSTLIVTFTGDVVLGEESIPVEVIYTHASGDIVITAEVSDITVNFQSIASQLVGLDLPSALHAWINLHSRFYHVWSSVIIW